MTRRTEMKRARKSQLSNASAAKKMAPKSQMANAHAPTKTVICKRGGANSTDKDPTRSPDSINDPQADALRRGRNKLAFNLGLVLRELEAGDVNEQWKLGAIKRCRELQEKICARSDMPIDEIEERLRQVTAVRDSIVPLKAQEFIQRMCSVEVATSGLQAASCDSLFKLARETGSKLATVTVIGSPKPFINEVLKEMPNILRLLPVPQAMTFHEILGHIIDSHPDGEAKAELLRELMKPMNATLRNAMKDSDDSLHTEALPAIVHALEASAAVCKTSSARPFFEQVISVVLADVLHMYGTLADEMQADIVKHGDSLSSVRLTHVWTVKEKVLALLNTWISRVPDDNEQLEAASGVLSACVYGPILRDYETCVPAMRPSLVLPFLSSAVNVLKQRVTPVVPVMLDAVIDSTLNMAGPADIKACKEYLMALHGLLNTLHSQLGTAMKHGDQRSVQDAMEEIKNALLLSSGDDRHYARRTRSTATRLGGLQQRLGLGDDEMTG